MPAASLGLCVNQSPQLRDVLLRYSACLLAYAAQSAACIGKHVTTKRLARWLLHAADQSGLRELALTQLFLSHMIGVRRSSVTVAAGQLRRRRLISYTRKGIVITNRAGLEKYSCECYEVVRSTYARLLLGGADENPLSRVATASGGFSIVGSPVRRGKR